MLSGQYSHMALGKDKYAMATYLLEEDWVHLGVQLLEEAVVVVGSAIGEEPIPEEGENGRSLLEEGLAPAYKHAPELQVTLPVAPKFWAPGPSEEDRVGCKQATPTSA